MRISSIIKYIVGDMGMKMEPKNCHISGPKPFPKREFNTMLVSMSPRASCTQADPKIIESMSFGGSRESPPEMTIPLIGALIGPITMSTVNH